MIRRAGEGAWVMEVTRSGEDLSLLPRGVKENPPFLYLPLYQQATIKDHSKKQLSQPGKSDRLLQHPPLDHHNIEPDVYRIGQSSPGHVPEWLQ